MSLQKAVRVAFNLRRLKGYILSNQYQIIVAFYGQHGIGNVFIYTDSGNIELDYMLEFDNERISDLDFSISHNNMDFDFDDYEVENIGNSDHYKRISNEVINLINSHTKWKKLAVSEIREYYNTLGVYDNYNEDY